MSFLHGDAGLIADIKSAFADLLSTRKGDDSDISTVKTLATKYGLTLHDIAHSFHYCKQHYKFYDFMTHALLHVKFD